MRSAVLVTLSCASVLALAGCGLTDHLAETAGRLAGTKVGQRLPTPAAAVKADPRGGTFCDSAARLGWPLRPTAKEIDTLSGKTLGVIVATDEHGAASCGWAGKGPSIGGAKTDG